MSFLSDLTKKYTELLNPVKQSLSNVSNSVMDNEGWYRKGQFTPVQQIGSMVGSIRPNPNGPSLSQAVSQAATNTVNNFPELFRNASNDPQNIAHYIPGGKTATQFIANRIASTPKNIVEGISTAINPYETGWNRVMGGVTAGLNSLSTIPLGAEFNYVIQPGLDYLKGVSSLQKDKVGTVDSYKKGVEYLSGQKTAGLGDALTRDPSARTALNIAELPLMFAVGHLANKPKLDAVKVSFYEEPITQISREVNLYKNGVLKNLSKSVFRQAEEVANEIIPEVVRNPEMQAIKDNDPKTWLKYVDTFLQDRLVRARNPEYNIGLNTRNIKRLDQSTNEAGTNGIKTEKVSLPTSPETSQLPETQSQAKINLSVPQKQPASTLDNSSSPYFNTNRLSVDDKSKTFVKTTIEEVKPQIEKVVGKKLSNQEAIDLSNRTASTLNRAVTREETLAWEAKMLKARELLAKQAQDGKVTQEYLDNLFAVKSQGSDIARKLQSLSINAEPGEATAKQAILEAVYKVTQDADEILKKAEGVDFNNFEQASSFYRQFVKPKAGDWLEKIRYSSMLSSPNTHINNFSSNYQGTGIIAPIEKTISGGVDALLSALNPKRNRGQFAGEGPAYAKGYYSNVGKAWTNFKDTLTGKKMSSMQEMYNLPLTEAGTNPRKVENVLSFPGKLLQAADEFFTTLTSGGVESQLKYRESKGIKVVNAEQKALLEAKKRLFNSEFGLKEEGPLLKALEFIPQKVAEARNHSNPIIRTIAKYTFPFVRIPSNILKASVEYSPMGVATIPGATNKVEQLSKAILGTTIGLTTATLVAGDDMTWAEPTDEKKRNAFRDAGMQPYSIRVGDKWYSYSKMHPAIAFNLALVAAIRDSEKNKLLDDTQVDTLLDGVSKWVNFYADMSYVKNLGDAVSGVKGDISAGTKQVANYVQQAVPFRALMGWVARMVDPYQRQADPDGSILQKQLQQLMIQIPKVSTYVPARKNSKGEPIENQNRIINSVSPIRVTNVNSKAETTYNSMVTKTNNTRQENVIKDRVLKTGKEEIFNGKKYYVGSEFNSKTGESTPVIKSIKVPQSSSDVYKNLNKEYETSPDSPKNIIEKIGVYGTGIFKDPKGTIDAIKSGQPIRKVRGDAVVVERLKNLSSLDQGDKDTEVDHVIPVALGGDNSEKNLQIISKQDNRAKGIVDTYLASELEAGRITKKQAQERDLNWRQELNNLPTKEKSQAVKILNETPIKIVNNNTSTSSNILTDLASREYDPIKTESGYSNVQIKLPDDLKLTGQAELDKQLKSKYSSALSTAKTNIGKLYLDGQLSAEEANKAIVALNNSKIKASGGKKPKKIVFKKPKALKLKAIKIKKIKIPKIKKVKAYKPKKVKRVAVKKVKLIKPKV